MSAATVEGAGVELAYDERGEGPPVVFVHGVGVARGLWDETAEALGEGFRAIAYDRRGYGDSGVPEGYAKTTVEEHADDLVAVIRGLDAAPAVLCSLSFASMACLETMAREPGLVCGAVLIEPPMLWLAQGGAEVMSGMREAVQLGAETGGSSAALEAFAVYVCGPQALDLIGIERMMVAKRSPRSFVADLGASWSLPPRELRGIEQPVTVVAGTRSDAAWREAAAALAEMLPNGRLVEPETGHLVPIEAPEVLVSAIRELAQA